MNDGNINVWRDDLKSTKAVNDYASSVSSTHSAKTNANTPTQTPTKNNGDLNGWMNGANNIEKSGNINASSLNSYQLKTDNLRALISQSFSWQANKKLNTRNRMYAHQQTL